MARKKQADKAESKPAGEVIIAPENAVLVLRTCKRTPDGKLVGYGGFPWPESGPVHAPEQWDKAWGEQPDDFKGGWNPEIACGGGLHAVGDLADSWDYLDWTADAQEMIVATDGSQLAASGDGSVAVSAGLNSRAKAGANGAIALTWHDGNRYRIAVGYVGEDGIKADTWYRVSDAGALEEVAP